MFGCWSLALLWMLDVGCWSFSGPSLVLGDWNLEFFPITRLCNALFVLTNWTFAEKLVYNRVNGSRLCFLHPANAIPRLGAARLKFDRASFGPAIPRRLGRCFS